MRALRVYGILFLATAIPFGVGMGALLAVVFAVFGMGAGVGLVGGLGSGVLFGLVMSLILGTLQLAGHRGAPRGMSLSPRQDRQVPVPGGPDLIDRVQVALTSLPAEVTHADVVAGRFVARTRRSWKSWGEEVVVQLSGSPAEPVATVSSRPTVRTTLVDYGVGRRNVERVVRALAPGA